MVVYFLVSFSKIFNILIVAKVLIGGVSAPNSREKLKHVSIHRFLDMGFTQACVTVQVVLQKVFRFPVRVTLSSGMVEMKEEPTFSDYSKLKLWWTINKFVLDFLTVFSLVYAKHLLGRWRVNDNLEQLCVYTIILCLARIGSVTLDTVDHRRNEIAFALTQSLKLIKFRKQNQTWRKQAFDYQEAFVFIVCGSIALICGVAPPAITILLDYHPAHLILKWLTGFQELPFPCKILMTMWSVIVYSCVAAQGAAAIILLLTGILLFVVAMYFVSVKFLDKKQFNQYPESFLTNLKIFRQMQIVMRIGNEAVENFLHTFLSMGVVLAVSSGYMLIRLRDLPLTMHLIVATIVPLCFIFDILLFTLAAIPTENIVSFISAWKGKLKSKRYRVQLRSCPKIGYSFGFVENCERRTGLTVLDVEVNGMASLSLINIS